MITFIFTDTKEHLSYPRKEETKVREEIIAESCDVWGEECTGVYMGDTVGEWLSDIIMQDIEAGLRLMFHNQAVSSKQ